MDLYNCLQVNPYSSEQDIKKSYRRLARIHHPDKNGNIEEFQKIQLAYEILKNEDTREEYDTKHFNSTPYELLFIILKKYNLEKVEKFLNIFYENKTDFIKDVNQFNFMGLYDKILKPLSNDININSTIIFNFEEIYNCIHKKITVKRLVKNELVDHSFIIPPNPYDEELIWESLGDEINNKKGNLIIKIILQNDTKFEILDEYNLLYETESFDEINLPNGNIINFKENDIFLKKKEFNLYLINNIGLMNLDNNQRGNLFIKYYK